MSKTNHPWQHSTRSLFTLLACLILALSLAACGKKPSHVDSPTDPDNDDFPLIYPDPATDPAAPAHGPASH